MTDQSSVFSEQTPATQPKEEQTPPAQEGAKPPQEQEPKQQPPASSDSVFADQLASIRNERGEPKYKDLPTALEALKHSQEYIPSLKNENETLKEKVERLEKEAQERQALEETIERLTATPPQEPDAAQPQAAQGMTEEQIAGLLEQRLEAREAQKAAQANARQVSEAIVSQYGEGAKDIVAQKCQEYGMTPAEMEQWAQRSPKAVSALFEVKPTPQGRTSTSSVNIPPVTPRQDDELRKPEKSLLSGASTKEIHDYMAACREAVNKRLGVTN